MAGIVMNRKLRKTTRQSDCMALIAIQNTMEDNNEVNGSGEPGSHCCILFLELIALQGYTPIVVIPIHRTKRCLSIKSLLTGLLWMALACSFLVSAEAQTPRHARVNGHLTLPTGVIRFPEIITITLTINDRYLIFPKE